MRDLMNAGKSSAVGNAMVKWFDCRQISGTDCYCDDEAKEILREQIRNVCSLEKATGPGIHFFDNGNYHYMSRLWTDQVQEDFDLVVFDHHPDMQPPRFEGILSCGGWVKEVLDSNRHVKRVLLIGVADHLIEEIKNEPSVEFEKYKDRVRFIAESEIAGCDDGDYGYGGGSGDCGCVNHGTDDNGPRRLMIPLDFLTAENIYVSIDKDALATTEVVTNWDQGSLTFVQLEQALRELFAHRQIIGIDICGERARDQEFTDGMDEGKADALNNAMNEKLLNLLQSL